MLTSSVPALLVLTLKERVESGGIAIVSGGSVRAVERPSHVIADTIGGARGWPSSSGSRTA